VLAQLRKHLFEFARCTRHNLLHLKVFKVSYAGGDRWRVTDGRIEVVFPYYPYLAFHDIEGYLQDGAWRIEPGMTVLDVGGCAGEFAVYAAKCVGPTGRVLMLEPDPANIELAQKNFALNGNPPNLEIIKAGLWKHPGKLRFNAGQGPMSGIEGVVDEGAPAIAPPTNGAIEIDVESLASLASRHGLERIDFVKMDIEGAELEVISAAGELPPKFKPRYAIASYHVIDGKKRADVLPGRFAQIGYQSKNGNERHLTTWSWAE
jgi:FkbM family methyltransferase